ncbi:hypothetical protein Q8F55_005489 [Vanrija albida]|uniref:Peptidase A1 domain-containing protein n=1 Tax=Vanrija albida TaxID=181172 RepID=A0ABR3Q2J3_9TREE
MVHTAGVLTAVLTLAAAFVPAPAYASFDRRDNVERQSENGASERISNAVAGPGPTTLALRYDARRELSADPSVRRAWLRDQSLRIRTKYREHLDGDAQERVDRDTRAAVAERRALRPRQDGGAGGSASNSNSSAPTVEANLDEANDMLTVWGRDTFYTTEVAVGTPPQIFEIHIDTGSANFYVFDSSCAGAECKKDKLYNSKASATFIDLPDLGTSNLTFGTGFSYGHWGADTVQMAGYSVTDLVFLRASEHDTTYALTNITGIMGMGWQGLSAQKHTPFWQALAPQWKDKRMGFYIGRVSSLNIADTPDQTSAAISTAQGGGLMTLGGISDALIAGDITYVPLIALDFWRIPMDQITLNDYTHNPEGANTAIIDTGSSVIMGPSASVAQLYANIPGAKQMTDPGMEGYYNFPCSQVTNISLSLQFGGASYAVNPVDMVRSRTGDSCTGSIMAMNVSSNARFQWIIGDSFLKNVYTVFRYDPPAVGFANLVQTAQANLTGLGIPLNGTTSGGRQNTTVKNPSFGPGMGTKKSNKSKVQTALGATFGALAGVGLLAWLLCFIGYRRWYRPRRERRKSLAAQRPAIIDIESKSSPKPADLTDGRFSDTTSSNASGDETRVGHSEEKKVSIASDDDAKFSVMTKVRSVASDDLTSEGSHGQGVPVAIAQELDLPVESPIESLAPPGQALLAPPRPVSLAPSSHVDLATDEDTGAPQLTLPKLKRLTIGLGGSPNASNGSTPNASKPSLLP